MEAPSALDRNNLNVSHYNHPVLRSSLSYNNKATGVMQPFHISKFALLLSIATSFTWIGSWHSVAALRSGIQASSSSRSTAMPPMPTIQAAPTLQFPQPRPISSKLHEAWENHRHPVETRDELGYGIFLTDDWRRAWFTYGQDTTTTTGDDSTIADESSSIIDPITGYANYIIDEIEGTASRGSCRDLVSERTWKNGSEWTARGTRIGW